MTNGISPTVRIWNNLKLTVQSSYNKMIEYDKYLQTHQRDIGVDEIQNFIRVLQGDLNNVQNQLPSLNTPTMTQPNNIQSESKEYKNIKLSEKQLHRIIKESVNRILKEGKYLPDGYDEEWEANVDDDSNEYFDETRPSMFGFPTMTNPYKDAKNRMNSLNDTESTGYPLGTIFGRDEKGYYNYDEMGNKHHGIHWGHYHDDIDYGPDDWDYDKSQPNWKTELESPYQHRIKPNEFAKDERSINRKSHMAQGGTYMKNLQKMKDKDDNNFKRAMKAADKRPLHRKGSLNRD